MFHNERRGFASQDRRNENWNGWTPPWFNEEDTGRHGRRGGHHEHGSREWRGHGPFGPGDRQVPFGEGRRFFGRGDVKFALLELLRERPMHGYEMIKTLEEKSGGFYTPSTGTIYPTLQMLVDRDLVTLNEDEGKKVYSITDAGRAFLAGQQENAGFANAAWTRGSRGHRDFRNTPELQALRSEAGEVTRLFGIVARSSSAHPEQIARIHTLLTHTRQELTTLLYDTNTSTNPETQATTSETPEVEQA